MSTGTKTIFSFSNLAYKLAALVLAVALWYVVQADQVIEINRSIQITLEIPAGHAIRGPKVRFKDATIRGPRSLLANFSPRPIEARIQLSNRKIGNIRIRFDKGYIPGWSDRLKITIHDAYLNIFLDKEQSRTLPIRENLTGIPADGFIIEKTTVEPVMVTVTGLRADLNKIRQISTEPIDISGIQTSKSFESKLLFDTQQLGKFSVEKVRVNLQVGEKKINRRFLNIPLQIEGARFQTTVSPSSVDIEIQGTPGVLSFTRKRHLRAFIDVRKLQPGSYEKKIVLKIPPRNCADRDLS